MGLLYDMSVPMYISAMQSLLHILKKGETWASENNVELSKLFNARLYDDMNILAFQVQTASNTAKAVIPRIAGKEEVKMEDNETTYAQLLERCEKTIEALKTVKPEDFDGKEGTEIVLFGGKYKFTGVTYLQRFGMPNFWFHVVTAYDILRNQGVPVGKMDFIAGGQAM